MTKGFLTIALISIMLTHFAMGQASNAPSLSNCTYEISNLTSSNFNDLEFLKKKVKNKRIVLLGESSHTIGDYYLLKTRIVKFLHQECGFDVFAMESGIADVYTVYKQLDTLSAKQLMKKTLFANLSSNEMTPLFEYIKNNTDKKLQYWGFDSQNHGSSLELIKLLVHPFYGATSDSLSDNLKKYYQIPSSAWQADKLPVSKLADTITTSASELIRLFQSVKNKLIETKVITDIHYKILERSLYNHRDAVNINWTTESPLEKRDSLMAENIFWLANEIFPNKKIIIWGHNTHIDKGGTDALNKSMGFYINRKMKKEVYHIGFYAKTGELYWWWTKDIRTFNNNQLNDIETFADKYPITFLDISKNCKEVNTTFMGYEAEFGRKVSFVPLKRYDAIINLRNVKATTY